MNEFPKITQKLHQFSLKFYTNELIRGAILFFSFGVLYLFFTLFIEYFLWLKPLSRTILFWIFIFVELLLLTKFILFPVFKIVGLQKGISFEESSKIIGRHFPEVGDKLLNILQLKQQSSQSDLLLASINQKSAALQPVPFVKAIDFSKNKKYLKYGLIPNNLGASFAYIENNIESTGQYYILNEDSVIDCFSVNNVKSESKMMFLEKKEFINQMKNLDLENQIKYWNSKENSYPNVLINKNNNLEYWIYFIYLSLICLILEIMIIKKLI